MKYTQVSIKLNITSWSIEMSTTHYHLSLNYLGIYNQNRQPQYLPDNGPIYTKWGKLMADWY